MTGPLNGVQNGPDSGVLPEELLKLLGRDSYSLLVKGSAATGKTILALTTIKELALKANYLYLSTRSSPMQLFENHPWLGDFLNIPRRTRSSTRSRRHSELPDSMKHFVDARLDEPTVFFERITDELLNVQAPAIFIDTWDSIGKMMDSEALMTNMRVVLTWRERADARLIVLMEDPEDKTLDSLFDGVVMLNRRYTNGRIVRTVILSKLDGVRISRPSSIFTLNEGLFQSFGGYDSIESGTGVSASSNAPPKAAESSTSQDCSPQSTGHAALEALLHGDAPSGTIVNVELAAGLPAMAASLLVRRILAGFPAHGTSILSWPFEGMEMDHPGFGSTLPARSAVGIPGSDDHRRGGLNLSDAKGQSSFRNEASKMKELNPHGPLVAIVGADLADSLQDDGETSDLAGFMRSNVDLSIVLSREGRKSGYDLSGMAGVFLGLTEIDGTLVLEPRLPWRELYAFTQQNQQGEKTVGLVPVV